MKLIGRLGPIAAVIILAGFFPAAPVSALAPLGCSGGVEQAEGLVVEAVKLKDGHCYPSALFEHPSNPQRCPEYHHHLDIVSLDGNVRLDDPAGCGSAVDSDIVSRGYILVSQDTLDRFNGAISGKYWFSHTLTDYDQGPILPLTPLDPSVLPAEKSEPAEATAAATSRSAGDTGGLFSLVDNPTVEAVTEKAVAPTVATVALANVAVATYATTSAGLGRYLVFFFSQPILLLKRRKRKAWGTVFNSLSRLPEDLVIVRLRDAKSGSVVRTEITDKDGRFGFIAPAGQYRVEAVKSQRAFPSQVLAGKKSVEPYPDLYHGDDIKVGDKGDAIIPNIPIDPLVRELPDASIVRQDRWRRAQAVIALLGPVLGGVAFLIKPSGLVGALFVLEVLFYLFFRRFAVMAVIRKWGSALEEGIGPVSGVILRVFALPYHKLLEYRVSDSRGRYNFRVGNGQYYLTASKEGYQDVKTETYDFGAKVEPQIITDDIKLKRKEK